MRTIGTILAIVLVIALGIWLFNRGDDNLVTNEGDGNATSTMNGLNGIGGPDDGFDPLDGNSGSDSDSGSDNSDAEFENAKG